MVRRSTTAGHRRAPIPMKGRSRARSRPPAAALLAAKFCFRPRAGPKAAEIDITPHYVSLNSEGSMRSQPRSFCKAGRLIFCCTGSATLNPCGAGCPRDLANERT